MFCVRSSLKGREQVWGAGAQEALAGPTEPWLRQWDAPRARGRWLILARGVGPHTVAVTACSSDSPGLGGGVPASLQAVSSLPPAQLLNTWRAGGAGEAGGPGAGIPVAGASGGD